MIPAATPHASSPPNHAHSQHPHIDLLIEQQNARLDQRFEALKGDLTQWFGYMSNTNMEQIEKGISEGFAAIRSELSTDRSRVVEALDALASQVASALRKIPPSEPSEPSE